MNINASKTVAGLLLALVAGLAQAGTIAFTTNHASLGKSFVDTVDGFDFESNSLIGLTLTKSALAETIGTTLKVSSTSGAAFDLDTLDLADVLNLGLSNKVVMNYTFEDGTTGSQTFTLDKKKGFQTFTAGVSGLDDLQFFTLKGNNGLVSFQLDNLKVSLDAPTPSVPEPGPLALMAAGLGLFATVARRRGKA